MKLILNEPFFAVARFFVISRECMWDSTKTTFLISEVINKMDNGTLNGEISLIFGRLSVVLCTRTVKCSLSRSGARWQHLALARFFILHAFEKKKISIAFHFTKGNTNSSNKRPKKSSKQNEETIGKVNMHSGKNK